MVLGLVPARPYINNLVLSRVEKGARLGSRLHCPGWGHTPSQPQEPRSPVTLSSLKSLKQSELPAQLSLLGMTEGDGTCTRPLCGQPHGGLGGGLEMANMGPKLLTGSWQESSSLRHHLSDCKNWNSPPHSVRKGDPVRVVMSGTGTQGVPDRAL